MLLINIKLGTINCAGLGSTQLPIYFELDNRVITGGKCVVKLDIFVKMRLKREDGASGRYRLGKTRKSCTMVSYFVSKDLKGSLQKSVPVDVPGVQITHQGSQVDRRREK